MWEQLAKSQTRDQIPSVSDWSDHLDLCRYGAEGHNMTLFEVDVSIVRIPDWD